MANPYAPPQSPTGGPLVPNTQRNRGGCLTAMLILMMVANPIAAIFYIVAGDLVRRGMPEAPDWIVPVLALASIANLAFAVGTWMWKKWGVYGFCATAVLGFVVNLMAGMGPRAFTGILGPVILFVLVRPLWDQFE